MIGKITGSFCGRYDNIALIDVVGPTGQSVGYEVIMKNNDIVSLKANEVATLYIKEIVKEDDDVLYGFISFIDKCWFEELIKLSGLGPKIALAILSFYSCENIENAIMTDNCDFFSAVSGIGGKLANRIPNEMRKNIEKIHEKVIHFGVKELYINDDVNITGQEGLLNERLSGCKFGRSKNGNKQKYNAANDDTGKHIVTDAVEALVALGFSKNQIYNNVFDIIKKHGQNSTENIIKEFLTNQHS